jgi:hypothetical protein
MIKLLSFAVLVIGVGAIYGSVFFHDSGHSLSFDRLVRPFSKEFMVSSIPKTSYLVSRTLPKPKSMLEGKVIGEPRFCSYHNLMTPDNQGGVLMRVAGLNDARHVVHCDADSSVIHYKADGSVSVVFSDNCEAFSMNHSMLGLDSKNNLYISGFGKSRTNDSRSVDTPVGRIVDFTKSHKVEPYIGMTSEFHINLLDHCSEFPELCQGEKITLLHLNHLSVDANDNIYLGFTWPRDDCFLDGYLQVTLIKIDASENVERVGNFPILQIDQKTNRWMRSWSQFAIYPLLNVGFSLAVDVLGNVFIHVHNTLLQFEKFKQGYGPVTVLSAMKGESNLRSIAASPDRSIYTLVREEQAVWKMASHFGWDLLLGRPYELGYQLGTGEQTRLKGAAEIVCDNQGRVFVWDPKNQAIIGFK